MCTLAVGAALGEPEPFPGVSQAAVQQGIPEELQGPCPSSAAPPALPGLLFPHIWAAFHPFCPTKCPQPGRDTQSS